MEENFDFCVVGSGILATATCLRLSQKFPNSSIALIGPSLDPNAATRCAGAMINVVAEIPNDGFKYQPTLEKLNLLLNAEALWDDFCEEISAVSGEVVPPPRGRTHVILNSRSTDIEVKTYAYIQNWLQQNQQVVEIQPHEVPGLKATDRGTPIRAMTVRDRHINPHKVLFSLQVALNRLGVKFFDDRVVDVDVARKTVKSILLKNGFKLRANVFVFANGFDPYGNGLHNKLGVMPIFANGGCALRLRRPAWVARKGGLGRSLEGLTDVIRMVDRGGACGIHLVPQGNGEFYLGASSAVWTNPEFIPKLAATQVLLNSALNEINYEFWHYDVELIGNGFRPTTVDGLPLIGKTSFDNAYILNGFKRDGFTCSPYVSKLLVECIENESNVIPIFSPNRKVLSYKTKHDAIHDALNVSFSSMYQHYQNISPLKIQGVRDADRRYIDEVYKAVRGDFGIHPEMLHLYADKEFFNQFKRWVN